MTSRVTRTIGLLLGLVGLLLPLTIMANTEPAAAQEPTASQLGCPQLSNIVVVDGVCYQLVDKVDDPCPGLGATLEPDGTSCRQPVAEVLDPECPPGSVQVSSACVIETSALVADGICPYDARGTAGNCYTVQSAAECSEGVLAGDVCLIGGPPPQNGPGSCPTSQVVMEDGDFCFYVVDDPTCDAPRVRGPDGCRQRVDERPGALFCDPGFGVVDGRCFRYGVPSLADCPAGASVDTFGLCRLPVADRPDQLWCIPGTVLSSGQCESLPPSTTCGYNGSITGCENAPIMCPQGFARDAGGAWPCIRAELAAQRDRRCPDGARGVAPGCYILVAKGTASAPGANAECPSGSIEDFSGECRKPVAEAFGEYFCPDPFASLFGRACVVVSDAAPVPPGPALVGAGACPFGTLGTAGSCYRYFQLDLASIMGEPTTTQFVCPVSATIFSDNGFCYTLVSRNVSNGGDGCGFLVPDTDPNYCRREVQPRAVAASCGADFFLIRFQCLQYSTEAATCPSFAPADATGFCRAISADAQGQRYCEDPDAALVFDTCSSLVETFVPVCPTGFSPDDSLGGLCARFEPASQRSATCPAGARGVPGDCYILRARVPATNGGAPECPVDSTENAAGECRQSIADSAGDRFCEDPAAALRGTACVFTTGFEILCNGTVAECGTLICPALSDGDSCYELVSTQGPRCAAGLAMDTTDMTKCLRPVNRSTGAPILASPVIETAPESGSAAAVPDPQLAVETGADPLAFTGSSARSHGLGGFALLALGASLVGLGRTRQRRFT